MAITLKEFQAEWCGPCKQQEPIVQELDDEHDDLDVEYIDIEEDQTAVNKYGVQSVPTIVLEVDGEVQAQLTGLQSKDALESRIDDLR